jgi:hypothetical protein
LAFGIDQLPAGQSQHAAQQGRTTLGKGAHGGPRRLAAQRVEVGAQAAEVAQAFGGDGAKHGQHQPQVLDQHRGVVHPAPDQGPQCHLDQGQGHHQDEGQHRRHVVQAGELLQALREGRVCGAHHVQWPRAAR